MDGRPVTASDVAVAAGVSLATVDRVLDRHPGVPAATVGAVRDAVERLGFRRDAAAANLARGRRSRLLVPRSPQNSFTQAVRREIDAAAMRGLDERTAAAVAEAAPFEPADLARCPDACGDGGVEGVAAIAVDAPEVRAAIARLAAACVAGGMTVSDARPSRRACFVGPDKVAAGRVAGTLLGRFAGGRRGPVLEVAGRMTLRDHASGASASRR